MSYITHIISLIPKENRSEIALSHQFFSPIAAEFWQTLTIIYFSRQNIRIYPCIKQQTGLVHSVAISRIFIIYLVRRLLQLGTACFLFLFIKIEEAINL